MTSLPPPPPPPVASAQPVPAKSSSGCLKWGLIGCGVVLVLIAAFVAVLVLVVFGAIKSSDVYKQSLQRAQNDPRVIAAIGSPIKAGWVVTGSVNLSNGKGTADINYGISGPKGDARVHAEGTKEPGSAWEYTNITVTPTGGQPIDVLNPEPATSTAPPGA